MEEDPNLASSKDNEEEEQSGVKTRKAAVKWIHPAWLQKAYMEWKKWLDATRNSADRKCAVHRPLTRTLDGQQSPHQMGLDTCDLPHQDTLSFLSSSESLDPTLLYNPRWFYWEPMPLVEKLCCPLCQSKPGRNGYPARPRRAVGLDEMWYIIGIRYVCLAGSEKCGRSFMSYDSRVLSQLPVRVSKTFHFIHSWRSGMTADVFSALRSCLNHGMGTKQFSHTLLELHLLRHVHKAIAYREAARDLPHPPGKVYNTFGTFEDPLRNSGFVPSSKWLSEMYDTYIEKNSKVMDQHTAMIPMTVGAIDHSHKVEFSLELLKFLFLASSCTYIDKYRFQLEL